MLGSNHKSHRPMQPAKIAGVHLDPFTAAFDERYRKVVANTPIIIYSLDQHGVFTLSQGLGLQTLGLQAGEVVGKSALEIYRAYPDIIDAIQRSLAGETVYLTHLVGNTFFDNRMVPLLSTNGEVVGIVGAAIDITELKVNEARIEESDRTLQSSYDKLANLHQELIAKEEELREQYQELLEATQQVKRQNSILATLEETTFNLLNKLNMDQLLDTIVLRAAAIVGADSAFISLPSTDGISLEVRAGIGIYGNEIRLLPRGWGLMGKVFASGKAEVVEDYANWEGRPNAPFVASIRTLFAVPLHAKQTIAGVLGVAFCHTGQKFEDDQIELLKRFAELASLALESAALHANMQFELDERIKSETTLNEIFNGVSEVILVNDPITGELLWANRRATEVFGYTEDDFKNCSGVARNTHEKLETILNAMLKAVNEGPQFYEGETTDKTGQRIFVEINSKKAIIHGKVLCLSIIRDITLRKQMEKDLYKTETEKQAVLDAIPDTMMIFDRSGNLLDYQAASDFETVIPIGINLLGKNIREVSLRADIVKNYLSYIGQALDTGILQIYEYSLRIRNIKRFREVRFTQISSTSVLALLRDITEMRSSQEQVEFLQRHDTMTKVYDRTYFEEEMYRAR